MKGTYKNKSVTDAQRRENNKTLTGADRRAMWCKKNGYKAWPFDKVKGKQ